LTLQANAIRFISAISLLIHLIKAKENFTKSKNIY
jgi:hypothetical protein